MDTKALTEDYHKYREEYETFQHEIAEFISNIVKKHTAIDIDEIRQRPDNKIKLLSSILNNISKRNKYKKNRSLFDIKDIAGLRITCCCEDDYNQLGQIIEAELKSVYKNVDSESKGEEYDQENHKKPPYRAKHFTLSKTIDVDNNKRDIFCEIQLRTVMGNAWAILNRKYVYKVWEEGEPTELTIGASAIMEGCEKIWSVVKRHKLNKINPPDVTSNNQDLTIITETQKIIETITTPFAVPKQWLESQKKAASSGFEKEQIPGYMEIESIPMKNPPQIFSKNELKDFARKSQIHTFGWPIGVYLDREDASPIIDREGIHAEIPVLDFEQQYGKKEKVYDYW